MATGSRLVFGPFDADVATGELRRAGERVPLQQQPFTVLAALLERPGELVSRDELRRRLWPDGTYVSFDRGLTSAMRKVREALDDRASTPVYIETLQGRGYRFIAAVRPVPSPGLASVSPVTSPVPGIVTPRAAGRPVAWGGARLAWAAVVVFSLLSGGRTAAPVAADERLAAAETLAGYACVLKSQEKYAEALEVIRRAHALAPDSARITAEVGFYLHAAGYYDDEFPMLRRALALDDRSADAWLHLGLAQARREHFDDAVRSLERAHRLEADNPTVERWLGWARQQQRKKRATA
jgi:DNA-binding winged helix-turn-helix (wHTH) protein